MHRVDKLCSRQVKIDIGEEDEGEKKKKFVGTI